MVKEFSKFEIAAIKRTAQNVDKYVSNKNKLLAKKAKIEADLVMAQSMIDGWQEPIKAMTGGFTTEDLVVKTIDKSGDNPVTKYELKFPDTVVPPADVIDPQVPVDEPIMDVAQSGPSAQY